jgi:hypothetical protein
VTKMNVECVRGRFNKNLRIGFRFDAETLTLLDGTSILTMLTKDTLGELMISPASIKDENLRSQLSRETEVALLESGSSVMFGVSPNMLDGTNGKGLIPSEDLGIVSSYVFVSVSLKSSVSLRIRGDQEARLSDCVCTIPAIRNKKARSLNHAFTIISEYYETKRRSHSGNVFQRAYAQTEKGEWLSLDDHRIRAVIIGNPELKATERPMFCG